jgi:beta-mannosidase
LTGVWTLAGLSPGRAQRPEDLEGLAPEWVPCAGPMTVAAALRAAGTWSLDRPRDFDADDWWYECRFTTLDPHSYERLHFDGLATVADVWLNGQHILRSESMFVASAVGVRGLLGADNTLTIRFHALAPLLASNRPRARWRTRLVSHQQLRWHRTTLLGRMPAWCPPVAPVGPWRPIRLERARAVLVDEAELHVELDGHDGIVRLSLPVQSAAADLVGQASMHVNGCLGQLVLESLPTGQPVLLGHVRVPDVERWWPHTHGQPALYPVRVAIESGGEAVDYDLGRVGFRTLEVDRDTDGEGFGLTINGIGVFCRGVCWTPLDLASLDSSVAGYRSALERLKRAGVNMVRVSGTMTYESRAFHDLCDELGILVWQDFMFANMDYPRADPAFDALVTTEAHQLLRRLQGRPSTAVLCGSSEVEQQAAMLGLRAERWQHPLFDDLLPQMVASRAPDAVWVRSTPTGGTLPFQPDRGITHYYGVGAYLRPFEDARRAGVRFAAECLAFSNIPDAPMVDALLQDDASPGHHPKWKEGVPRDAGVGWDFEDVRDHYVRLLCGVDPSELRARDVERYLTMGRISTGESMLRTISEWRRPGSTCRGGLVWFACDLRPGAGWGVLDSAGRPKAAYWYLKRACAPVALLAIDEGLNGLWLHAVNDTSQPIEADLRVALYREGRLRGARVSTTVTIPERGFRSVHADALFGGFVDLTYGYRFGPPGHDVVAATLTDRVTGAVLATAHGFPCGLPITRDSAISLTVVVEPIETGYAMTLATNRFAHAVAVEAEGFVPDDNFIHLEPDAPRRIVLHADVPGRPLRASVAAVNSGAALTIESSMHEEVSDVH